MPEKKPYLSTHFVHMKWNVVLCSYSVHTKQNIHYVRIGFVLTNWLCQIPLTIWIWKISTTFAIVQIVYYFNSKLNYISSFAFYFRSVRIDYPMALNRSSLHWQLLIRMPSSRLHINRVQFNLSGFKFVDVFWFGLIHI